jgi:hypothetical protein
MKQWLRLNWRGVIGLASIGLVMAVVSALAGQS